MILFECPACAKGLTVEPELAGTNFKCPKCGQVVLVPAEAASPVPTLGFPAAAPGENPGERTRAPQDVSSLDNRDAPTILPVDSRIEAPEANKEDKDPAKQAVTSEASRALTDFLAAPLQSDEIGRLGSYRVLKVLGAGGMGVVFKAEDPGLERIVAIKAMLPALAASASAKIRFLREAKAAAAIKHIHIVTIFQVGEDRGVPFLTMEFLEGESLDDRLKRATELPIAEVVRIGREMAEGLGAAHELGLIHRDIKPANTWLEGAKGHVKILDFGLARSTDDEAHLTQSGVIVGTPAFMSPEQCRGDTLDARADLWSLGVVLYLMCTGEVPFKGTNTLSTLRAVEMNHPWPPAKVNAAVPLALSDLVMRLLKKDPGKRIASAHQVAEALRELEGQSQQATLGAGARTDRTRGTGIQPAVAKKRKMPAPPADDASDSDEIVADRMAEDLRCQLRESRNPWRSLLAPFDIVVEFRGFRATLGHIVIGLSVVLAIVGGIVLYGPTLWDIQNPGNKKPVEEKVAVNPPSFVPLNLDEKEAKKLQEEWAAKLELQLEATNKIGMKLMLIPPAGAELPNAYYLGKYEVTQGQWKDVMGYNPSEFGPKNPIVDGMDTSKFPVESVNWLESVEFCNRLSEREDLKPYYEMTAKKGGLTSIEAAKVKILGGSGYHIPTDAEWEHGCRAGTKTQYHCGDTDKDLLEYAWFDKKNEGRTYAVGEKKANAFGLHDMHGNVWEWNEEMLTDAKTGVPERVARGGGWSHTARECVVSYRSRIGLSLGGPAYRISHLGLRVARFP